MDIGWDRRLVGSPGDNLPGDRVIPRPARCRWPIRPGRRRADSTIMGILLRPSLRRDDSSVEPVRAVGGLRGALELSAVSTQLCPMTSAGLVETGHDLVEVSGLEPPASSLRTKRSSQLSYTPAGPQNLPVRRREWHALSVATGPKFRAERTSSS